MSREAGSPQIVPDILLRRLEVLAHARIRGPFEAKVFEAADDRFIRKSGLISLSDQPYAVNEYFILRQHVWVSRALISDSYSWSRSPFQRLRSPAQNALRVCSETLTGWAAVLCSFHPKYNSF